VKLLTKAILERLPKIGETAEENDPVVWVKFFDPFSQWTWYVIEYDGEDLFFGYVEGIEPELGHFTLSELASLTAPHQVERDRYFHRCRLHELWKDGYAD